MSRRMRCSAPLVALVFGFAGCVGDGGSAADTSVGGGNDVPQVGEAGGETSPDPGGPPALRAEDGSLAVRVVLPASAGDGFPDSGGRGYRYGRFVGLRYTVGASLPITPTTTGSFVAGVWAGNVTVQQVGDGVYLRAEDGNGHAGDSNTFDVHALGGDLSASTASLGDVLAEPLLIAPVGDVTSTRPRFQWSSVEGATTYDLWLSRGRSNSDLVLMELDLVAPQYDPTSALPEDAYAWWVRARCGDGRSAWSDKGAFRILAPFAAVDLVAPVPIAPKGETRARRPTFRWTSVSGAAAYDLWVFGEGEAVPTHRFRGLAGSTYQLEDRLAEGDYVWYVRATGAGVCGPWSGAARFARK